MWEGLDQRRFPRLNLACDIDIRNTANNFHVSTVTQNIGAGGVCVILPDQLARFSKVFVRIHLRDGGDVIESFGKVCWLVPGRTLYRAGTNYDIGIEFLDIREEDRERIRKLVREQSAETPI